MIQSSKVTNILLAIIAICLLAIVLKPAGVLPTATAQLRAAGSDADRFAEITASSKAVKEQVAAIGSIATAIEGLAESAKEIAQAIDNLARATTEAGGETAEAQAASVGVPVTP